MKILLYIHCDENRPQNNMRILLLQVKPASLPCPTFVSAMCNLLSLFGSENRYLFQWIILANTLAESAGQPTWSFLTCVFKFWDGYQSCRLSISSPLFTKALIWKTKTNYLNIVPKLSHQPLIVVCFSSLASAIENTFEMICIALHSKTSHNIPVVRLL